MFKKLFMASLFAGVLAAGARPSGAQTFSGYVKTSLNAIDQGLFSVSAVKTGAKTFHVTVGYASTFASAGIKPAFVNDIQLRLLTTGNLSARQPGEPIDSGSGGVGSYAYTTFNFTPFPTPFGGQFGFSERNADGRPGYVTVGQSFSGNVTLRSDAGTVSGAYFGLTGDGGGTGVFTTNGVTPEGASLLLLLPGLIPVAVGLRRRRLNKPAGE